MSLWVTSDGRREKGAAGSHWPGFTQLSGGLYCFFVCLFLKRRKINIYQVYTVCQVIVLNCRDVGPKKAAEYRGLEEAVKGMVTSMVVGSNQHWSLPAV